MAKPRAIERLASLPLLLEWSLGLRVLAADLVQWYAQSKGALCVFPDTTIYWLLAGTIRDGRPFEILDWGEIPRFALRTPGYPAFLAGCRLLLGDRPLGARLVQAVLGMFSVWLVFRLARRFEPDFGPKPGSQPKTSFERSGWTIALVAAALAAFHPYLIVTSALLLTEAVFLPLMLLGLCALAALWSRDELSGGKGTLVALGGGLAWGYAVLVRPSWALFVPCALGAWILASAGRRRTSARGSALIVLGLVIAMAPWWVRNQRLYGRFVPTALWSGASLYDGLNPRATGASDMSFMNDPELWPLDEETQDAVLRSRAWAFVRDQPGRALWLTVVKFARYWSPWPNADAFRSVPVALASASFTIPLFVLLIVGVWTCRRDPRALVVLAGPLLYFCLLHLAFASSMRYRIPAEMPALPLAAIGLRQLLVMRTSRNIESPLDQA